tara:strand:+ start:1199 stop:1489 length:291 start_codon:yes stop_codon:yes gene_type:complete
MNAYTICNQTSGIDLGTYRGATPADALDDMARDAGYADYADACEVAGDDGLLVTPARWQPHNRDGGRQMIRAFNILAITACWIGIFGLAYVGLVLA